MSKTINWYFPFALAVLEICSTQLFSPLFNPSTRWLFVLFAFVLALNSPYGRLARKTPVFALLLIYLFWCLMTVSWSELMELSLYKVLAAMLVLIGMFSLGFAWASSRESIQDVLKSFYWFVPAVLLVAISGKGGQGLMAYGHNYYAGLAGNSNNLGWMMGIALPILVWKAFEHRISTQQKWFFFSLVAVCGYYLLLSQSRTSMVMAFCAIFGLFVSLEMSKRIKIAGLVSSLIIIAILLIPNFFGLVYSKFILKGSGSDLAFAIEQSRGEPFRDSLQGAKEGGLIGAGYGISIGANPHAYDGGLSAVGYGREKVSSPLAIVEETGVIGLILMVLIILNILIKAFRAYRCSDTGKEKAIMGMLIGLLIGMLFNSSMEAWLVAPGSSESIIFWGVSGMIYATSINAIAHAREGVKRSFSGNLSVTGGRI